MTVRLLDSFLLALDNDISFSNCFGVIDSSSGFSLFVV